MSSLNKIILVGNIEGDVEEKVTTSGNTVAKFKLNVPRNDTSGMEKSDTFDVVCWNELAETVKSFNQNELCVVEGRISNRSFETDMGQRKYVTEIEARKANTLGSAGHKSSTSSSSNNDFSPFVNNDKQEADFEFDSTPDIARAVEASSKEAELDVPF